MNISKYEWVALGAVMLFFVLTVIAMQFSSNFSNFAALSPTGDRQQAAVGTAVGNGDEAAGFDEALQDSVSRTGVTELIIDEVERGSGAPVGNGDTVTVHYEGSLPNGERFDSSRDRGEPFTFTVGQGRVIEGWEEGILGMREGGTRILVIPPDLGYGPQRVGAIPPNATLVFTIELLEVN